MGHISNKYNFIFIGHSNHICAFYLLVKKLKKTGIGKTVLLVDYKIKVDPQSDKLLSKMELDSYSSHKIYRVHKLIDRYIIIIQMLYLFKIRYDDVLSFLLAEKTTRIYRLIYNAVKPFVRVISVQHTLNITPADASSVSSFPSDLICVWGNKGVNDLTVNKCNKNILITGSPLCKITENVLSNNDAVVVNSGDKSILLYVTQYVGIGEDVRRAIIIDLLKITGLLNNVLLVVKLHPNDPGILENEIISKLPPADSDRVIIERANIDYWLEESDIILSMYSNVIYESILLSKKIIILNYMNISKSRYPEYLDYNVGVETFDVKTLLEAVSLLLNDDDFVSSLRENGLKYISYCNQYSTDHALSNIVDAIIS